VAVHLPSTPACTNAATWVERCFNKLKQFRAIAARHDRLASRYHAGLLLASLVLWLRHTELSDRT
jgi:transposase